MMLTTDDLSTLITSMEYTKRNLENYTGYPSYEFKVQQVNEAQALISKLRAMRKAAKEAATNG